MTEIATRDTDAGMVGSFDPRNEKILRYLGLDPADSKSIAVVAVARRYDLDPLLKHVVLIEGKGKPTVYITRDGYLHIAHMSRVLDGIVVDQDPTLSEDKREWTARVSVWRKDMSRPFTFPGRYPVAGTNREYAQEMALKAAESHALRRAFNVAGLPSLDEQRAEQARANANPVGAPTAAEYLPSTRTDQPPAGRFSRQTDDAFSGEYPAPAPADQPDRRTAERGMFAVLGELKVTDRDERLAVCSAILNRPVGTTGDMTDDDLSAVRAALQPVTQLTGEDLHDRIGGFIVDGTTIRAGGTR